MDPLLALTLILFLLLAEGFFSASEFALISINKIKLRYLAENGGMGAKTVEKLLEKPSAIFGTTSVGTNLCVFAGSAIATALLTATFTQKADLYTFLVMGPVTLVFGEIVPKMFARNAQLKMIPFIAAPLSFFQRIFHPVLLVTTALSHFALKLFVRKGQVPYGLVTRDEILQLTRISEGKLDLAQDEKKMIHRIFEFKKTTVEEAMQPLVNIVALPTGATIEEAKTRIARTGVSRLPVYSDRIFNIVGIVSAFDILKYTDNTAIVDKIMERPLYTPLTKRNSILLREMREGDVHMAVALDEYGAAAGIVTVEDLVEEIIGDIEDEYDSPVKLYEDMGNGRYIVDAMMEIDSVNEKLGLSLPKGDYETVNGFLVDALERIPGVREKLAVGSYLLTVLKSTDRKIQSVEIVDCSAGNHDKGES